MDRAREVAREHRERDAHAQREHRERQMAEQARRQSEYERSGRPPGPGYPGQGYEDQRGQRPGPQGYSGPPPRHPPPEHFRHNGPPPGLLRLSLYCLVMNIDI